MSRLGDHSLDRALNESWPPDPATTPDRQRIPVVARVVWRRAGEESIEGYATRWSGRSVFVSPIAERCRNGTLGVWLDCGTSLGQPSGIALMPRESLISCP
jgi:hypothetical protein